MTLEANTDLLDIKAKYKNNIKATELEDLKTSLCNIERETSAIYNDLCTWKAPDTRPTNTRPPAGVNSMDQDEDTERVVIRSAHAGKAH